MAVQKFRRTGPLGANPCRKRTLAQIYNLGSQLRPEAIKAAPVLPERTPQRLAAGASLVPDFMTEALAEMDRALPEVDFFDLILQRLDGRPPGDPALLHELGNRIGRLADQWQREKGE